MRRSHRSHSRTHLLVKYYLTQASPRLNMLWTSVNYPDCPDLQIIQKYGRSYRFCKIIHIILQIMQTHRSKYAYVCKSYIPYPGVKIVQFTQIFTQVDHTDPADYTDPADQWRPPINACRSCRSYRPYLAQDVQVRHIGQIPSRSKCTDFTDHTESAQIHIYLWKL